MTTSDIKPGEGVKDVHFTEDTLSVDMVDGRTITVPLVWYPRLLHATPEQRQNWQISGGGFGIHWPDIDEDLSTEGLLILSCIQIYTNYPFKSRNSLRSSIVVF